MEYLAKIIHEQKSENKLFWKYIYVDLQTNQEDYFLNNYRINYVPVLIGKLSLLESDTHPKFYQSFELDIANVGEENQGEKALTQLAGKTNQGIEEVDNETTKKEKLKLSPRQIIELEEKGLTQKEIAKIARRCERTIRYWKKSTISPSQKVGRKLKIKGDDLTLLLSYISSLEYNTSTQQEMSDYVFRKTGQRYSQQVISLTLKRNGITRKTIPYRYSQQKALMLQFWEFVSKVIPSLPQSHILATDESGFPLNLAPRYGYARKGCRVVSHKPGWGSNYSLLLVIQNVEKRGIIHWELVEEMVGTDIFHNFLSNVKFPNNEKHYLLLDNIRFHHSNKVKKLLISKNIEPTYLVPYFPQLNPTELLFNVIKQYVRKKRPRTEEELRSIIAEIINKLQEEDLTKYFRDCLSFKINY